MRVAKTPAHRLEGHCAESYLRPDSETRKDALMLSTEDHVLLSEQGQF